MKNIRISIPTHSYLKQFSEQLYGNPIQLLSRNNFHGKIPLLILNEFVHNQGIIFKLSANKQNLKSTIHVSIPVFIKWKDGSFINSKKIDPSQCNYFNINYQLQQIFEKTLINQCISNKTILGISYEKTIDLFCSQYGITENMITQEALKKIVIRKRQNQSYSASCK